MSSDPQSCSSHDSPVFVAAWEEQLTEKQIPYSKQNPKTLCYDRGHSFDADKARLASEAIYRGAAMITDTVDEKGQLLEYIHHGKREHEEQPLKDGRTFVVVYSDSRAQLEQTQVMFRCIQNGKDCL